MGLAEIQFGVSVTVRYLNFRIKCLSDEYFFGGFSVWGFFERWLVTVRFTVTFAHRMICNVR